MSRQAPTSPGRDAGDLAARMTHPWLASVLSHLPLILFALLCVVFSALAPGFFSWRTLRNVLVQSSSVGIVAVGMTFVVLTGGIDLSVGAAMFLAAAIAGRLAIGGWIAGLGPIPVGWVVALVLPMGLLLGSVNAVLVAGFRLMPFIVTLATLFIGRGLALRITETRPLNLPPGFLAIGQAALLGIPLPVLLLSVVVISGHVILRHTPYGRQLYALGSNPEAARRAGLPVARLAASVYLISGLCAALAGMVSVAQLGAVSPTFGLQREFAAIAAAVLGGTSLLGGRGSILPGTLLGALLIQTVETGLNMANANPYSYPIVLGAIIYVTVLISRLRPD
ncbi:MAG: ABC transporter permease [Isosphaeraceae bacterium]